MRIALYQGKSPVSWAIRFITRSKYSHAAFLFDEESNKAAGRLLDSGHSLRKLHYYNPGAVVEAWDGGVKNSLSISSLHQKGTVVDVFSTVQPLSCWQEEQLVMFCSDIIGWPYSYWNVLKFVTKRSGKMDGSYFCSEAVFEGFQFKAGLPLLRGKQPWEVPPDWLQMPTNLIMKETRITR
jgi:uncharacterized protein YycO